jgi:hypothetical protein
MEGIIEFLTNFYWPLLPQVLAESMWHANWKDAYRRGGIGGLGMEALQSLLGTNSYPFLVPMSSGWSGRNIQRLLAKKGIRMWGWAFADGVFLFHVRRNQAAWAQYVLLHEGVPLQGPLLGQTPDASAAISSPSEPQSQRSAILPNDLTMDVERQFDGLIEKVSSFLDL